MKKKIIIPSVCAVLVLALALTIGIYWYYHPTHYKFNDRFIIGSTVEEIVEKYGDYHSHSNNAETKELSRVTYMIHDNTPELIMSYDDSLWYEIYFEDGIAVEVKLRRGWIGG